MKTFIKAVLIIGCTLFLVGLLLAMFGLALGGRPDIIAIRLDDMGVTHNITAYGNKYFVNRDHDFNWDNSFYDDWDTYKQPEDEDESGASGNLFEPFAAALPQAGYYDISRLEFRFGAGDINIVGGDSFELIYGNDFSRNFFYERHDADTWTIGSSRRNWGWLNGWRYGRDTLKLTIVLPYDFVAEYAVIEMGAGNLQARQLYAREISLDTGAGNCQIGNLLADQADLHVGVGNMEIKRFHAASAKLDVGLGNVDLRLTQPLEKYRYDLTVGLGSVTIGASSYNGMADLHKGAANLPYYLDISCGLGNVNVSETITISL